MACIDPTHVEHQTSPGPAGGTPAEAQARAAATPDVATCADTIGRRPEAVAPHRGRGDVAGLFLLVRVQLLDQPGHEVRIRGGRPTDEGLGHGAAHAGRAETIVKPGPVRLPPAAEPSAQ